MLFKTGAIKDCNVSAKVADKPVPLQFLGRKLLR
jgi:hypothetical protein